MSAEMDGKIILTLLYVRYRAKSKKRILYLSMGCVGWIP